MIAVAPDDFSSLIYFGWAFALKDCLGWTDLVAHQEQFGFLSHPAAQCDRGPPPATPRYPACRWSRRRNRSAGPHSLVPRVGQPPRLSGPVLVAHQVGAALDRVQVPVLLQTGWQDLFLQQTPRAVTHLYRRGLDVALTIGPWTHLETIGKAAAPMIGEGLDWLAEHLAGTVPRAVGPVRVYITGAEEWHDLPEWPPDTAETVLYLRSGGVLDDQPAPADPYPPHSPTIRRVPLRPWVAGCWPPLAAIAATALADAAT